MSWQNQKLIKSVAAEAVYSDLLCDIAVEAPQNGLNVTGERRKKKHLKSKMP